jgi:hypothetical protein
MGISIVTWHICPYKEKQNKKIRGVFDGDDNDSRNRVVPRYSRRRSVFAYTAQKKKVNELKCGAVSCRSTQLYLQHIMVQKD